MKNYKSVSIILVPLILSLMIVKVNAGNNYIPADAKTMYNLGKSYLQSKNYHIFLPFMLEVVITIFLPMLRLCTILEKVICNQRIIIT